MSVPLKVVYIENDPDLYEVIGLALRKMGGFDVSGFKDTETALAYIAVALPDAVFVDCAHVDGKTAALLKDMRANPACVGIPVILASDRKRIHQIRRYKAIGATTVIPTPINPFSLTQTIRAVMADETAARACPDDGDEGRIGIIEHMGVGR